MKLSLDKNNLTLQVGSKFNILSRLRKAKECKNMLKYEQYI